MLKNIEEALYYSKKFGINIEDILFIDLNISGINVKNDWSRVRFPLKLNTQNNMYNLANKNKIVDYYFALPTNKNSKYTILNNSLMFNDTCVGEVENITEDFCDSSYFRRNGTVLNLNPHSRTSCRGCKFCYTIYQTPRDKERLLDEKSLVDFFDNILQKYSYKDLSHMVQIAIVTGCFEKEKELVTFLLLLNRILKKYNFKGEIFYLGSQITRKNSLDQLTEIKNFAYCLSLECFTKRNELLHINKQNLSLNDIKDILMYASEIGIRTNFSYILGLEGLEVIENFFPIFLPYINSFPIINVFQQHKHHFLIRDKEAENFDYYIKARIFFENLFKDESFSPRAWENYRSLWYLSYNGQDVTESRTPGLF